MNKKWRVLIVDDEEPARLLVREMLESHADIEIVGEAADGIEALRMGTFCLAGAGDTEAALAFGHPALEVGERLRPASPPMTTLPTFAVRNVFVFRSRATLFTAGVPPAKRKAGGAKLVSKFPSGLMRATRFTFVLSWV